MPPPSLPSTLAICLRCRFRYSHRLQLRRSYSAATATATTPSQNSTYLEVPQDKRLLILESLAPRKSRHRFGIPEPPPEALQTEVLKPKALQENVNRLMIYEELGDVDVLVRKPAVLKVSAERYEQLHEELGRAFLRGQLKDYYNTLEAKVVPRLRSSATKREFITGILKDKWGVEIAEDISQRFDLLVEKEIASSRRDIFFMLGGEGRILREWSHKYQARIRINVQSATVIVRACQANIECLEASMANLLVDLIEEVLDMSWVSRLGSFNDTFITPIATITNTFIEKIKPEAVPDGDQPEGSRDLLAVRISALEMRAIEDARRLLFTSLDLQLRSSYSLLYSAPHDQEGEMGALFPTSEAYSLPWRFRGTEWARWRTVKRNVKKTCMKPGPPPTAESRVQQLGGGMPKMLDGIDQVRQLLDMPVGDQPPVPDQAVSLTEYEGVLGYLLHGASGSEALKKPQALAEFIKDERLRVLCNDFPGMAHLTQNLASLPTTAGPLATENFKSSPYRSCILKLLPSPWARPESFERYPPLEVRMQLDPETGEPFAHTLTAIHSDATADILFPNGSCDVRFRRRTSVPLGMLGRRGPGKTGPGIKWLEFKKFKDGSQLNPLLHYEIRAVPQLEVSLPAWMVDLSDLSPTPRDGGALLDMTYLLTGLEYRREMEFDWKGISLHQTLVQGGVTGGRKTEMKLVWKEPSPVQKVGEGEREGENPAIEGTAPEVSFSTFATRTAELVDELGRYIQSKAWRVGRGGDRGGDRGTRAT